MNTETLRILDIDFDFFLTDIPFRAKLFGRKRLEDPWVKPSNETELVNFFESKCGLNKKNKIRGKYFINHHQVFYFLRYLQLHSSHPLKFEIDHVDAHADLGMGFDSSYIYICSELLQLPLEKRYYPKRGTRYLHPGNFLVLAAACRWLEQINFITHLRWPKGQPDLPAFYFKNFDTGSGFIQLKQYTKEDIKYGISPYEKTVKLEPKIPFKTIASEEFISDGKYDYIFLTQSPSYTPLESDKLIPMIMNYMITDPVL